MPHGVNPACSADYLRKRFSEAIWESQLTALLDKMDPEDLDAVIDALVERLLTEAGVE